MAIEENWKFIDLDRIQKIYPDPSMLLNRELGYYLKLDGACTSARNKEGTIILASRNNSIAPDSMINSFKDTSSYEPIQKLLRNRPRETLFGELLQKGSSPTKIETHKKNYWIGFNIRLPDGSFMDMNKTYEIFRHYGIPTAPLICTINKSSLDELYKADDEIKEMMKGRHREGAVGKTVDATLMWKSKPEEVMPIRTKVVKEENPLEPLPDSEAFGAVDKAFMEIENKYGIDTFFDKTKRGIIMPIISRYINTEIEKHGTGKPKFNFFYYFEDYSRRKLESIKE